MTIAYLRPEFGFNLKAGGSIAHIKGVTDAMRRKGYNLTLYSSDYLPSIDRAHTHVISPGLLRYGIFGIGTYLYNFYAAWRLRQPITAQQADVLYCRYSLLCDLPVRLARRHKLPLILEFNGSEVWIAKHWGVKIFSLKLAEKLEQRCLDAADVIVVVSSAVRDDLRKRGIPDKKILVNPNGADPTIFNRTAINESARNALRAALNLKKTNLIAGFIGTFGKWHGAGKIVDAAHALNQVGQLEQHNVRFVLVGDGVEMPLVKQKIAEYKLEPYFRLPGLVPQADGAKYLSLFDIALNPTVPNSDGSTFFGSPTKLFEYMAMETAIISSNIGQMGELFTHKQDAYLYDPTLESGLATALTEVITTPTLRTHLAKSAHQLFMQEYTWDRNVERTIQKLNHAPSR